MRDKDRYFECQNCGQVIQGWHAAFEWLSCCNNQRMVEIERDDSADSVVSDSEVGADDAESAKEIARNVRKLADNYR